VRFEELERGGMVGVRCLWKGEWWCGCWLCLACDGVG
jgi:hypothetical protein